MHRATAHIVLGLMGSPGAMEELAMFEGRRGTTMRASHMWLRRDLGVRPWGIARTRGT
jgi:hypothetical protein